MEFWRAWLQEQIGYRIPNRNTAVTVLGLNCVGLLVAGVWLARQRRLERLAIVVPVITGLAAAVFLAIGGLNAGSVPPTVVSTQVIRLASDTG